MAFCRLSGAECRKPCPRTPAPLPLPRTPPSGLVARLNQRFALGRPSDTIEDAGLLVHQFDRTTGQGETPWVPLPPATHVSCSVFNARTPHLYSPSAAGVVLSPRHARIRCLYATDGGTTGTPDGCGRRARCTPRKWWMCNWPPTKLRKMLEAHAAHNCRGWNEVIVGRADWLRSLPALLEAVFFMKGRSEPHARRVHAAAARYFGRNSLPLLSFDLANSSQPFRRVAVRPVNQSQRSRRHERQARARRPSERRGPAAAAHVGRRQLARAGAGWPHGRARPDPHGGISP